MKRLNNRGVSLIEILIAVVIFALCVTPIIAQLASSIRIGQRADDQQAATDYGKSVAETVKQTDLDALFYTTTGQTQFADSLEIDSSSLTISGSYYSIKADGNQGTVIPAGSYVIGKVDGANPPAGQGFASVTAMYQKINLHNASASDADKEALVREFQVTGTARIDHRDYDIDIALDTLPYAKASLDTSKNYVDPNAVNLGNLSSLDSSLTAVIPGLSNYDSIAAGAYFNAIVSALENSGNDAIAVQIKNGTRPITNSVEKIIEVQIDELSTPDFNGNQYEVTCMVTYKSPSIESQYGVSAADTTMQYVALQQRFKDMPEVYLMYNQFLYYNDYQDDQIQIENNSDEMAKVYVIRTAETDAAVSGNPSGGEDPGATPANDLIPTGTNFDRDEKNGANYLYMTQFDIQNAIDDHPVAIYTNMPLTVTEGGITSDNISSSTDYAGDRSCKMSVNVPASQIGSVVYPLDQDERYSEQGRTYNILITLTNQRTGNVTTFDTSRGDY